MLPGVTSHHVDAVCAEGVGIVQIELQQGVTLQLPILTVLTESGLVVASAPSHRRVVGNNHIALALRHVVTQIQVGTQFGQEVELVVELGIADATIDR